MSLSTQTIRRLPQIKSGLLQGLNYGQIGDICQVTEKTIDRDVRSWVESGEFETWIKEEWLRLHAIVIKKKPVEAYRNVTNLLGKMVTRRIEKHEQIEVSEEIVTVNVTENEDEILSKAAAILSRKDRFKKLH